MPLLWHSFQSKKNTLRIFGTPVLTATMDEAYAGFTVSATGGKTPYVFSLVGIWPTGLTIDPDTGEVSGTVPEESDTGEVYPGLSVRVTDDNGRTKDLPTFSITVDTPGVDYRLIDGTSDFRLIDGGSDKRIIDGS